MKKAIISAIICLPFLFAGCSEPHKDYGLSSDWIYVNDTEHKIEINSTRYSESFIMLPGGSFIIHQSGMMGRKPTVEDCITPFDQYWLPGDIVFIIDDEVEIAITSGGIIERENYAVKKIDGIFCWEFTYTFTEAEIDALLAEQEQEQEPSE